MAVSKLICLILFTVFGALAFIFSAIYMIVMDHSDSNGELKSYSIAAVSMGIIGGALQTFKGVYSIQSMFKGQGEAVEIQGLLCWHGFFFLVTIVAFSIGIHFGAHNESSHGERFVSFCALDWVYCILACVIMPFCYAAAIVDA